MSMELLAGLATGALTMAGVYLLLRARAFTVLLGLTLLSYAVNLFVFASGRMTRDAPPILGAGTHYADPLAQALVLTAIVIGFAMTAFLVGLAIALYRKAGTDRVVPDETDADR